MASAWCATTCSPFTVSTAPSTACPPSKSSNKPTASRQRRQATSCRATAGDDGSRLLWLPRRDILTGMGGAAAGLLAGYPGLASSAALDTTTLGEKCPMGDKVNDKVVSCTDPNTKFPCPQPTPAPATAVDFKPESTVKRVRRPVHLLTPEEQEKYKEAVRKMRALPSSNPLSFTAQAAIHQAYCDKHYIYDPSSSKSNKPTTFDVHNSWLFPPWHRMYIYFYEKALGDLIGDDTFALPYWSWDTPAGMVVPAIFKDNSDDNPLHDGNRNPDHLDTLVHLDQGDTSELIPFDATSQDPEYKAGVFRNLCVVYQQQVRLGTDAPAFLGSKFCTQSTGRQGQGTLERMAHTAMHVWAGRSGPPPGSSCSAATGGFLNHDGEFSCQNDMGNLGSAGRDPLFYSHHSNVDRMWHLWSTVLGNKGFDDDTWLDASFDFYDNYKNPQLVRIKFRDVLETRNLGYTYDAESEKDLPWMKCQLTSLVPRGSARKPSSPEKKPAFPVTLRKSQVVVVPAVAVPPPEKKKKRLLVIEGIEYDPMAENEFDVAINVPRADALRVGPEYTEYAGNFAVVPSSKVGGGTVKGKIALCIDGVLKDIGAASASTVDVVIVPRTEAQIKLNLEPTIQA
ncbi:hypothetical protein HU200_056086 [Digitaria exilis]|uniref:Tyrosinase copper-binding domain-containing protein n=1 Tax=Digitaria exilis TaxID=1010633 RepID=A0A835ARW6_9POAL|nr:hypothetical protein HU200_056086 [Digitaria exilis]CAB3480250.1 unnamed protein product [Digitaria exilis]